MTSKIALTSFVLAAAFAGNALAETPLVTIDKFVSTRARADLQAELVAYKQAGVNPWSTSYNPLKSFRGTATREAVVAEYLASRGEVRALTGEDSGSMYLAQMRMPAPRDTLAGQPLNAQ